MNVGNAEWENVSGYIVDIINETAKQPLAEDTKSNVMKAVCKDKSFKQFTKKHVCINVKYKISEKRYIISNWPRLQGCGMALMVPIRVLLVKNTVSNTAVREIRH